MNFGQFVTTASSVYFTDEDMAKSIHEKRMKKEWTCEYCKSANSISVYKCTQCGAPK